MRVRVRSNTTVDSDTELASIEWTPSPQPSQRRSGPHCAEGRGLAKKSFADAYVEHLKTETFPAIRALAGFEGSAILKRDVPGGVEFLVITRWESLDAIRAFAGDQVEVAVVPAKVQAMMLEYDRTVAHYEEVS